MVAHRGQAREGRPMLLRAKRVLIVEQERVDSGFGVGDTVTRSTSKRADVIEAEFRAADRTLGGLAKAVTIAAEALHR